MQMFGSLADDDPEANEDDESITDFDEFLRNEIDTKVKKKRGRKPKIREESPSKSVKMDTPLVLDHVLFQNCAILKS